MAKSHLLIILPKLLTLLANNDLTSILEDSYIYNSEAPKGRDANDPAKPATSCHLWYNMDFKSHHQKYWRIENTVKVATTTNSTYFATAGFYPGGYNGIQTLTDGSHALIFSLWNDGTNNARLRKKNKGVVVAQFGGEGTGLRAMKAYPWKVGTRYRFSVVTKKKKRDYRVACYIKDLSKKKKKNVLIAEYARRGINPLSYNGFYSFIEDWDRTLGTEGHLIQRSAEFLTPQLKGRNPRKSYVTSTIFDKNENGDDAFAADKAHAHAVTNGVFMSTGGDYSGPVVPKATHMINYV